MINDSRVYAIDWLRATAMVWMAIAHAGIAYIAGYHFSESPFRWQPGTVVPDIYLTRFITHFCAPTFLFVSGVSLFLSTNKRLRLLQSSWEIDRQLMIRGATLIGLELVIFNVVIPSSHGFLLQVLYAIGACLICMTLLRRLPIYWLLMGAIAFLLTNELLVDGLLKLTDGKRTAIMTYLLTGGSIPTEHSRIIVSYPVLPWLNMMLFGWCFGYYLANKSTADATRLMLRVGIAGVSVFLLIRGLNGYGNMNLLREAGAPMTWLVLSKYPPSLGYVCMEFGFMGLLFAGFLTLENRVPAMRQRLLPFAKLGQAALFFYIVHHLILDLGKSIFSIGETDQWWVMYVTGIAVSIALVPVCAKYLELKSRYPRTPLRYV